MRPRTRIKHAIILTLAWNLCISNAFSPSPKLLYSHTKPTPKTKTKLNARYGAGQAKRDELQRERLKNDDGALSQRRQDLLSLDPEADARYIQEVLRKDDEEFEEQQRRKQALDQATLERVHAQQSQNAERAEQAVVDAAKTTGVDFRVLPTREKLDENGLPIMARNESRNNEVVTTSRQGTYVGSAGGWSLEVFPGDFVVHRKYGIGRFEGVVVKPKKLSKELRSQENMMRQRIIDKARERGKDEVYIRNVLTKKLQKKQFVEREKMTVLEISYADAMLHVPIEKAYRLSRYRAGEAAVKPKLSKMKGDTWKKQTDKVLESTKELAEEVLALYATRETLSREPFKPSVEDHVREFGDSFQYEPTPDQKMCFETIENDMVWRRRPMDRLVCGDVGFGKTEVALRAIFRCIANGRQVALLAPTGVLAAQHFKTCQARMGPDTGFNVTTGLLRGGLGPNTKAGKLMRSQIKSGELEVIVGTHALLSKNVDFKDLGLLVIDEEQRFGVKQKERLKLIAQGVDVLTLSATPIPRTLQMSLSGIRDTSTIRTPPPMRKSTITVVEPFSMDLLREAVEREISRGGQCFYVVPRIAMVEKAEEMFAAEFPGLSTVSAHGQMGRGQCEAAVENFAMGQADILIATTVIENGVDIPNTNTIIIQQAQIFGMSTLYQLRGRVGRSNQQAYAYLLHGEEQFVTEQAEARLNAMAELQELGSGFDVASRDLEIRGAGSLLGTEQSGMAGRIGFDLYMRMLKKAILQCKGLGLPPVPRTNILLPYNEGSIEGKQALKVPDTYIEDPLQRSKEESSARLAESSAVIIDMTNRWKSEYGALPKSLILKLKSLHLHASTRMLGIDLVGIDENGNGILRCPGLRPRMWAAMVNALPSGTPPPGLRAIFPPRFSRSKKGPDADYTGTSADFEISMADLVNYDSSISSDDEEEWDEFDDEEVEAMKEITSATKATSLEEANVYDYPRFIVEGLGDVKRGQKVDVMLKMLLPLAKFVKGKQEEDKERAKVAVEVREKREAMKKAKRGNKTKQGYYY